MCIRDRYNISIENGCVLRYKHFKRFLNTNRSILVNGDGSFNDSVFKLYIYEPPKYLLDKQALIENPDLLNKCLEQIVTRIDDPNYETQPLPLNDYLPGERVLKETYLEKFDENTRLLIRLIYHR